MIHYYLSTHFRTLLKPEPLDPQVQKSMAILNLLVGKEETARIKADLKNQVDVLANSDNSPPRKWIFRA